MTMIKPRAKRVSTFLIFVKSLFTLVFSFSIFCMNAQVGIGTTTPHSTLDVRGSLSSNHRSFTSTTAATSTDNILTFTGISAATLTLPDATTCTGRAYWIKNTSATVPTPILTLVSSLSQTFDGKASWLLDDPQEILHIVSNGANWTVFAASANMRTNYVLVKSAADLPAPVAGIITLSAGWLYEINGIISLSNKINLNDAEIKGGAGFGGEDDALIYTGATELFTGSKGGDISHLKLSATTSGAKLFNINALGANEDIIILNCFIKGNDNIGMLQGFGGDIIFQNIDFDNNTNGITFQNDSTIVTSNLYWNAGNHNIFEKYIGTFQSIQKSGGIFRAMSANSAIALDVSGIISITSGASIKATLFDGTGLFVTGTFSKQWEVESFGLNTEKDDVAAGNLYVSTTTNTTFTAADTPTKILGTTTPVNLFRVTSPVNNRLTYTGTKTRRFQVICSLSATQASSNMLYSFYIVKNGVIVPESKQVRKLVNSTDQESVTISCTVSLAANDHIEVWVENNTNTTALSVETFNLAIK